MSCVRKLCKDKGISDEIAETIIQSWRPNTKCKYDTYRKQWLQFCSQRMCDPMCPTLVTVLEFLHVLRKRNLGYSVLNSARGMLSSFATIEGYDAGKHPLVCRYMKSLYNSNPSLPKRSFTWDAGAVLRYLSSVTPKSLLDISRKLASLLAILCGQREREMLSVMDIRNTTTEENFLIIRIGDQLKTTGIKFHVGEIKFPVYENANVCPVKLFKQYIDVSLMGSTTCLFITTSKPYRPASKDTLTRWIKSVLHDAGIDMTIFTPHSTRLASTSKAATKVTVETVLKTGGWRSMRTFANHCNKQINNSEMFATSIVM